METKDLIELGGAIIALIGVLYGFYKMNLSTHNKINENSIKIIALEKDIIEMKDNHEKDITELRLFVVDSIREIKKENREDHGKIFSKLESVAIRLEGVSASFESYLNSKK